MLVSYIHALTLIGLVLALGIARTLLVTFRNPLNKLPGPWHTKFCNLRLKMAVLSGRRIHYIHTLHQQYGSYVRISPSEIAVNDPKGFKQIHGVNSGFEKSSWYKESTNMDRPVLFDMADKHAHGARRKLFARGFSKSNIKQNWETAVKEKVEIVVRQIKAEASRQRGLVDVMKWFTLMANDVSSHLLFGESFHSIEKGETNEFIRILTTALKGGGIGAELPWFRTIGKKLPFQVTKELFTTNEFLDEYAKSAVRNMRAMGGSKNVFANILAESEKGEARLDDRDVEVEAVALFIAGTDTTAVSLTYLVWAVLGRPELRRKVEEEVATLPDGFQDADVEKLPLLNAVIEETLRLYGAAPGALPRIVPDGGVDMGGHFIPQGSTVTTHAYSMHRDPDLFPDPLSFIPDRWLDRSDDKGHRLTDTSKAVLSPFGSGSRSCLGIHLAYSELRLASAEFFRNCPGSRLASSTTPETMEPENYFLIAPAGHKCEVILG